MIRVDALTVAGKLTEVTCAVQAGEVVAVVGSRGSGKTTLLRAVAGQCPIQRGNVTIGGRTAGDPAWLALFGAAGEAWGLMDRLSVWENLSLTARLWGVPPERVSALLQRLDLEGRREARVHRLTPGETARLRLARALVHDPPALLLDEPAGDVDSESASLIAFTIAEEAEAGKAVLVTTFGDPRILRIASRICYLEGGRLMETADAVAPAGTVANVEAVASARAVGSAEVATRTAAAAAAGGGTGTLPPPTAAPQAYAAPDEPDFRVVAPHRYTPHVAARKGDRILLFRPDEIRYAFAREKSVYIETPEGTCGVSFTLTELEERLAESGFFRSHKAYLVNLAYVKEIASWTRDSYSLILKGGGEVPLSKHRAQELRVRLNW